LPDPDDLEALLRLLCNGQRSVRGVQKTSPGEALKAALDAPARQTLRRLAPNAVRLASGRRAKVQYPMTGAPVIAARLQWFFGETETPRLGDGSVAAVCHLLAPNGRPAQITSDLAGFWRGSYSEVRKELRGRYPKHHWPDDPLGHSS
jgi:ATP-dependent helicase HrpB